MNVCPTGFGCEEDIAKIPEYIEMSVLLLAGESSWLFLQTKELRYLYPKLLYNEVGLIEWKDKAACIHAWKTQEEGVG